MLGILLALIFALPLVAPPRVSGQPADVRFPQPAPTERMSIAADQIRHWNEGKYEVWLLQGNVLVNQGLTYVRSTEAVLWLLPGDTFSNQSHEVTAYFDGDVTINYADGQRDPSTGRQPEIKDKTWFGRFQTFTQPEVRGGAPRGEPDVKPSVYDRAYARRNAPPPNTIQRTQFTQPFGNPAPGQVAGAPPPGTRRLRAFARSSSPVQAQMFPNPGTNEWIAVVNSGITLIVDGLEQGGSLDISADRIVVWTSGAAEPDFSGQSLQRSETPLEIYMEGNIEFRQGDRLIRAQAMYYDVRREIGTIIKAEALTPVPRYEGLVRLRADVIQQLDRTHFQATNAQFTTSRLGDPRYALEVRQLEFEDRQSPVLDPITGYPLVDPTTGQPVIEHQPYARANNNLIYIEGIPVFYWPTFAGNVSKPVFYIERIVLQNDNIFGFQVLTDWDMYQLLGIKDPPKGTDWTLSLDEFTKRGFFAGTKFKYDRLGFFDIPGPARGEIDVFFGHDGGLDVLGRDRSGIPPEPDLGFRGWVFGHHRQELPDDWVVTAELGYVTDRNFVEQWQERTWDTYKDLTTGVEIKKYKSNSSMSLTVDYRINDFFTQTNWLPRFDHFWLGQSLAGDSLTWFEHSSVAYAQMRRATAPTDPIDAAQFGYLPWEADVSGGRYSTRQEIDYPLDLGPVKIVPYALGEFTHWDEDLTGGAMDRVYYQGGVRATLPFWAVNPFYEDDLLNLHGLAHKASLEVELAFGEANRNLEDLPLYDQLDDDAIEAFRRRFPFDNFGGPPPVPRRFDERFYALRTGLGGQVTSPSTEIADDLFAIRTGLHQRWQTKRGAPDNRHVVDWITLDTDVTFFPKDQRDNYGEVAGLATYDFRWLVGDRLTLTSDGAFDFFDQGQKEVGVGGYLSRPPRGTIFLGFRSLEGPISSNVLTAAYLYRMSPKWAMAFSTAFDFSPQGTYSQTVAFTRIGESFLTTLGFNVDDALGTFTFVFMIEPRFLPKNRLTRGGLDLPPAGAYGLE